MVDSIAASTLTGVSRAMIRRVPTVEPKAAVTAAIALLGQRNAKDQCSCVLAVEDGHIQGMLTQGDALRLMTQGMSLVGLEMQAVMTTPVVSLRESEFTDLRVALGLLQQHQIRHLPILDDQDCLVGLITHESLMQVLYPEFLCATLQQDPTQSLDLPGEPTLAPPAATDPPPVAAVLAPSVQIKSQSERERLVAQIAMQIRASLSLQTILDTTVDQVRRVLHCDRVNVWKFEDGWERVVVAESTDSDISLIGERVNDSSFSQAQVDQYQQGAMRIIVDVHTAEMTDCHKELLNRLQTRSKIMVPLLCDGTLWGFLNVTESQYPRNWQPEETDLLEALSVHLSIALHQAINHEHLQAELTARQQAEARLEIKNQLLAKIANDEPLSDILNTLIASIEQRLPGAYCSVLLLDDDNRMRYAAAPNLPVGYLQASNGVEAGEGVGSCGTAIYRRATVIVADIASDRLWEVYKDFALHYGLRACWSIPIVASNDQVLGTFAIYFREPKQPQPQELELIESMVDLAGIAIERHRFEKALNQSEARWQFALEGAGDGIWDWNLQDNTVFFSRQWKAILGLAEEDEVNSRTAWESRIHPDDRDPCNTRIQGYLQGETATYQNEHRIQCKDGSYKWVLDRGTVMEWSADGAPQRMIGIYTDISDRKAAETILRKSEATLQETQEICHLGSWEMELPSQTITWSQELFRMFRCDPNQAAPSFAEILQKLHPDDRQHLEECIAMAITEGKP
ncbi:MAG TPA: GAF domain-containing protein [Stenomitos sp.]